MAGADVGLEVHAAGELAVAAVGRTGIVARVAAQVSGDVEVLLQRLLRGERLAADAALVLRALLVLLQVLAHDGRRQRHVVALVALRELGVRRRRHAVHREQVVQHVVPLHRPVAAKLASLAPPTTSNRFSQNLSPAVHIFRISASS